MVWTAKPGAPATFSIAEAFAAQITGDVIWGWLVDWIPILGYDIYDTGAFCAEGPSGVEPLTLSDFLVGDRNPYAAAANTVMLAAKIQLLARDRVFGAFCEQIVGTGWTCETQYTNVVYPTDVPFANLGPIISGKEMVRVWLRQAGTGGTPTMSANWYIGTTFQYFTNDYQSRGNFSALNDERSFLIPAGMTHYYLATDATNAHFDVAQCVEGGAETYEPTAQPEPDGYIAPLRRTYEDIADLGAELDRQEDKLDRLAVVINHLAVRALLPADAAGEPVEAEEGVEIDLAEPAADGHPPIGVLISLSSIPGALSADFGAPIRLFRAGRVSLGTADGWYADYEIEHTPFVIAPLPPSTTRMLVNVPPPIVASVTKLFPKK